MIELRFHAGTIEVRGTARDFWPNGEEAAYAAPDADQSAGRAFLPESCLWDARSACFRAPAIAYSDVVMRCVRAKLPYDDQARQYLTLEKGLVARKPPRPYQAEALKAWQAARNTGTVVLPTGAGKTYLALMAIDAVKRSTLIVVPTLDLARQWSELLRTSFDAPVGVIGGGDHNPQALTVITYDSAYIHMEHLGARFGLIVFDECHHLPGEAYAMAAKQCLAPFRLGLSATPERTDGRHVDLEQLIGPWVFRLDVVELAGDYLADYRTERVIVDLTDEELAYYNEERNIYRGFVTSQGIRMSQPGGWQDFVMRSSRSEEGRRAFQAYQNQRRMAFAAPSKLDHVARLLHLHRADRTLLFTQDNKTAHTVSLQFLIPVITHQTKVAERTQILRGLAAGKYRAVVTSKVLNEGVDVPDANVAIVISGSGSVREHVQRLGRILRKKAGKDGALLYELISGETAEAFTSSRRREHSAYR